MLSLFRRAAPPAVSAPTLTIGDRVVPVELIANSRASRMTLRADPVRGAVRVTLPPRSSRRTALAFIEAHRGWIAARVAAWPEAAPFLPGAVIPFDGSKLRLDWGAANPRGIVRREDRLIIGGEAATLTGRVTRWLRAAALADVEPATRALAARIERRVAKVAVRDPVGRWGSCSSSGTVSYSWRLILAPPAVRFSVVAHEVAHLVHPNHGKDFWALAAELNGGDPAAQRGWLRQHGASLHWVGRAT